MSWIAQETVAHGHDAQFCCQISCTTPSSFYPSFRCEMLTKCWLEKLKKSDHFQDLDIDVRIILEYILGKQWWDGIDWIHLAPDIDRWRVLVYTVMDVRDS